MITNYGILRTYPQSGTFIAGLGIAALEGLISDVLEIEETDFQSLVETRVLLEIEGAAKAAERRTADDIIALTKALEAYEDKVNQGLPAVEEDLLFHIKIAEASKNKVLKSLMLIITPDIVKTHVDLKVCGTTDNLRTIQEHKNILNCIIDKDVVNARLYMNNHLKDVLEFSKEKSK